MDRAVTLARLSHDVGKYIARAARNVPPSGVVPPALVDLLVKDLYAIDGKERASSVFAKRVDALEQTELDEVRASLSEIDALEPRVRARDEAAVRRAVVLALSISDALDALARGARE
jgi:hypothetical protein